MSDSDETAGLGIIETCDGGTLRVLVVDDNLAVRTALVRLLSKASGLELLDAAESGEEAVEFAVTQDAEVVIMDVSMPGIGGIEATRRLKATLPRCRVIGHSSMDGEDAMRAAGAADFVQKGDPPARLLGAIRGA